MDDSDDSDDDNDEQQDEDYDETSFIFKDHVYGYHHCHIEGWIWHHNLWFDCLIKPYSTRQYSGGL